MLEYFQEMLVSNDDQYEALVASYLDFKQHSLSIDVMPCHQLAYYLYNRIKEGCDHICFHHELMHITNFQCLFIYYFTNGNLVGATLRNLDYCIIAYFRNLSRFVCIHHSLKSDDGLKRNFERPFLIYSDKN